MYATSPHCFTHQKQFSVASSITAGALRREAINTRVSELKWFVCVCMGRADNKNINNNNDSRCLPMKSSRTNGNKSERQFAACCKAKLRTINKSFFFLLFVWPILSVCISAQGWHLGRKTPSGPKLIMEWMTIILLTCCLKRSPMSPPHHHHPCREQTQNESSRIRKRQCEWVDLE